MNNSNLSQNFDKGNGLPQSPGLIVRRVVLSAVLCVSVILLAIAFNYVLDFAFSVSVSGVLIVTGIIIFVMFYKIISNHEHEKESKRINPLVVAFLQGAKYWEYKKEKATMWQSDQTVVLQEANKRLEEGSLGKHIG